MNLKSMKATWFGVIIYQYFLLLLPSPGLSVLHIGACSEFPIQFIITILNGSCKKCVLLKRGCWSVQYKTAVASYHMCIFLLPSFSNV
jgi:hypothetical protein